MEASNLVPDNFSKFCVKSVWYLQQLDLNFDFWEAIKDYRNSLHYFASLLDPTDQQLEGMIFMSVAVFPAR